MGSITGAAGGVIRDVFINEIPLIFRKEIYAMACVVGGIAYWICDLVGIESYGCQLIGGLVVFLTRILAVKYHICLPILKGEKRRKTRLILHLQFALETDRLTVLHIYVDACLTIRIYFGSEFISVFRIPGNEFDNGISFLSIFISYSLRGALKSSPSPPPYGIL